MPIITLPVRGRTKESKTQPSSEKEFLSAIFQYYTHKNFNVRTSQGELIKWTDCPKFTIVINNPDVLKKIILYADDYKAGKAFIDKDIDIEGNIFEAIQLADYFRDLKKRPGFLWDVMAKWCAL